MKKFLAAVTALVVLMYAAAELTRDRDQEPGVTVLYWATDTNPARNAQIAAFNRKHPDLRVAVDPGLGGNMTKLRVQCATGVGPDLIDIYTEEQMIGLVNAGILLNLNPHAAAGGFGPENTWAAAAPVLKVGGAQYRFPCNVSANCVIFNREIFDDHAVPYPEDGWTWEEFIETGRMILDTPSKSGEEHIAIANYSPFAAVQDLLLSYGARRFSEDGRRSQLDSPEAIAAMQMYHDMIHVHGVMPTPAEAAAMSSQGGWGSGGINWFSTERAAMIMAGRWYVTQLPHYPGLAEKLGSVLMPHVPGRASTSRAVCRGAGINVQSPNIEESLRFLEYLASPRYSECIVEGGDALPPDPGHARTGADLTNPVAPDPDLHATFIKAVQKAASLDNSPYIDAQIVQRWLIERIEQVENQLKTPEKAMREYAIELNQRIERNIRRDRVGY
jgi:multiple sugar transport system substrate-binding protein